MLVIKNARVNALGEPLFEKVMLTIRPDERVLLSYSNPEAGTAFLSVLGGEEEFDQGTFDAEGAQVLYLSPESLRGAAPAIAKVFHTRPTFLLINTEPETSPVVLTQLRALVRSFRGGILLRTTDTSLLETTKVSKVLEFDSMTKSLISFTGTYEAYQVEKNKRDAKLQEAYEKQQKEKVRLEAWLEQKRKEAAFNRSPERGATIRAKTKYLQREILDKEIPNPNQYSAEE